MITTRFLARLFNRPQRIVITISTSNGRVFTDVKMDKRLNINHAAAGLDKAKGLITFGLSKRVNEAQLSRRNPKQTAFIRKQTIGDIL